MEAVYENWFDYEINGKMPLSLLESQFNEEYDNFMKMMNAIDICNESNTIILEFDASVIKEKIDTLVEKFKKWVKAIKIFLADKWKELTEFINKRLGKEVLKSEDNIDIHKLSVTINGKSRNENNPVDLLSSILADIDSIESLEIEFNKEEKYSIRGKDIKKNLDAIDKLKAQTDKMIDESEKAVDDATKNIKSSDGSESNTEKVKEFEKIISSNQNKIRNLKTIEQWLMQVKKNIGTKIPSENGEKEIEISEEFMNVVKNKDLLGIRLMIKNSLIYDPYFKTADKYLEYCKANGVDIFVEDDGEDIPPESKWNEDEFNMLTTVIVNNFSKEKFSVLKKMAAKLFR